MNRGRLIVISAPSGAGKTSICLGLMERHPGWHFSVSGTTRPKRPNEVDGKHYHFLSDEAFDRKLTEGDFAEWEQVHEHRYGTMRSTLDEALDQGDTLLLDVDVKGGKRIQDMYRKDTISIFIDAPDYDTLVARLTGRATEKETSVQKRLQRIPEELRFKKYYDHVVINDDLQQAINEVDEIVTEQK